LTQALPSLSLENGCWECTIALPSWTGFQSRRGPYGSLDSQNVSDGSTQLSISPPDDGESPPSGEQAAAYSYLVAHHQSIRDQILAAVLKEFPRFRARFYEIESPSESFPTVNRLEDLRNVLGLTNVLIHTVILEDVAYVGYEFGCAWDAEHGLGAMTHRDRIVALGGADTAILEWIAERDVKRLRKKVRKPTSR